jgi:hypothetical protein
MRDIAVVHEQADTAAGGNNGTLRGDLYDER